MPWVCGVNALDIREDLAGVGLDGSGDGDRGQVGRSPAEGCDVHVIGDALEAGDDHNATLFQLTPDAARIDRGDPGLAVPRVRANARLCATEADGVESERLKGHGNEGATHLLARRQQRVQLPRLGPPGYLAGQLDELVGSIAHG